MPRRPMPVAAFATEFIFCSQAPARQQLPERLAANQSNAEERTLLCSSVPSAQTLTHAARLHAAANRDDAHQGAQSACMPGSRGCAWRASVDAGVFPEQHLGGHVAAHGANLRIGKAIEG